ncbi:MAG: YqaA family protein [Alphaproteobacteria bacterium]
MAIRKLYNAVLKQAEKPYAAWILFVIATIEASVFPIPPDALLVPMAIANRRKAYRYALICTLGSVLGALIGYAIGALAMATIGQWVVTTYHLEEALQNFQVLFEKWGVWIILIKGLIFIIPFKLVTIACGLAEFNLIKFVLACLITRAARFYLLAWLISRYGEPIKNFIERYLGLLALLFCGGIVLGFWLVLGH